MHGLANRAAYMDASGINTAKVAGRRYLVTVSRIEDPRQPMDTAKQAVEEDRDFLGSCVVESDHKAGACAKALSLLVATGMHSMSDNLFAVAETVN